MVAGGVTLLYARGRPFSPISSPLSPSPPLTLPQDAAAKAELAKTVAEMEAELELARKKCQCSVQ